MEGSGGGIGDGYVFGCIFFLYPYTPSPASRNDSEYKSALSFPKVRFIMLQPSRVHCDPLKAVA